MASQIWDARHIAIQKLEIRVEHIYQYIDTISFYFDFRTNECRFKSPGRWSRLPTCRVGFTGPEDATKSDEDTVDEDLEGNINELTGNMCCYVANSVHWHADGLD